MKSIVTGDLVSSNALPDITDWAAIKKASVCLSRHSIRVADMSSLQHYKLNGDPAVAALEKDQSKQKAVVDELVTSFVAMKSVMS